MYLDNSIISGRKFFTRFHLSSALKTANAYKKKGTPATEIFQYLFPLIFSNRSMHINVLTDRNTPAFAKDTVIPLDSEERVNVLIIDDAVSGEP